MQEEHFSLYLDLEEGRKADLEVVARASLSLAALLKEVSYIVDPSIEIRIELESGTKGSFSLNTIIKTIKEHAKPSRAKLVSALLAAIVVLLHEGRSYVFEKVFDEFFVSEKERKQFSDNELDEIALRVKEAIVDKVAKDHAEQIYREIERDGAIKGIGVTATPGDTPTRIVPREQFKSRSGSIEIVEESSEKRSKTVIRAVTLVSPVLIEGKRQWRFRADNIEFGAKVVDKKFVSDLLHGKLRIAMKSDIQMIVEMTTDEEKIDDVWIVKSRTVLRVIKIPKQSLQTSLDFSEQSEEQK